MQTKWNLLQLFGDTGSAAWIPTGVTAADAGQQERAETLPRDAAAENPEKPSWEQLMEDPEYNSRMQRVVQARLRKAGEAESQLQVLSPVLEKLAKHYGLQWQNPDYAALAQAVQADGTEQATPEKRNMPEQQPDPARRYAGHIRDLETQAAALQTKIPGFDLRRELGNPVFVRLTAPGSGLTVEDAYFAVHRERLQREAMEAGAQTAARKLSDSIRAGSYRPRENTGRQAAAVDVFDYRRATPQQRAELKQRIREAAARGEKLYP